MKVWGADNHYDAISVANVQKTTSQGYNYLKFSFTGKRWDNGATYDYSVNISIKSEQPKDGYLCGTVDIDGEKWYFSSTSDAITTGSTKRFLAKLPANNLIMTKDQNNTYHLVDGTLTFASSFTATPEISYIYHFKEITMTENDAASKLSYGDMKCINSLTLGRTLSSAYYNTFCSPISFDATQVTEIFGTNTDIRKLESSSYDQSKNELTLIFSETSLNTIEAGVPYIIQPAQNVNGILLTNVATSRLTTDPQTISSDYADFYGILEPYTLSAADPTFLFLAADNELTWGDAGTLNGMRAYFKIKGISDIQQASMAPARMQFGSKTISTDLETVSNAQSTIRNGKYMYNGHLVIVHNGKKYNL